MSPDRAVRIGIGGSVGTGKTALGAALCRALAEEIGLAVVTNDIYTEEDAEFLRRAGVLDDDRITAVQGMLPPHGHPRRHLRQPGCRRGARGRAPAARPRSLESGGDNLTATFSRGLVDHQIFVLDVAGGDKVPRKGGPGVTNSDLLVVNKTDLAPLVGADLAVMARDAAAKRGAKPVVFCSLVEDPQATAVTAWSEAGSSWPSGDRPGRPSPRSATEWAAPASPPCAPRCRWPCARPPRRSTWWARRAARWAATRSRSKSTWARAPC